MAEKKIKLNLGCGIIYKPGYLNIDKFNTSVADKVCDVEDLPFESNSVDIIEALHLIEHFDYIHCKYVLSEWFRVLKPMGKLVIETPDLERSFKKFNLSSMEIKKKTLQWIYGIDSPGMQHKTGFSFGLIKDLLNEIGFEKISKEKPKTHLYEPGMRIVCQKSKNFLEKQLFASFRKKLKKELEIDDSYLLLILENWVNKLFRIYSEGFRKKKTKALAEIISQISICHPKIPQIFLKECENFGLVEKDVINYELIDYLIEIEFHKRLFSLWEKRKKNLGRLGEEFENFILEMEMLLRFIISKNLGHKEELHYIEGLNLSDIKIFDFQIVQLKARELFNQGVKEFHNSNFSKALNLFLKSVKINQDNPLSYWNLARLKVILNYETEKIENDYKNSLFLVSDKNIKNEIKRELNNVLNKRSNLVPKIPIPEDY
jgi:predicted SAM-dependent methyltransferase